MQRRADPFFITALVVLLLFGFVALSSASAPEGYAKFNDVYYFVKRQFLFGLLPGILVFLAFTNVRTEKLLNLAPWFYGGALALLVCVFIPGIGSTINGSRSWIHLGPYSLQPSEIVKFAVILYFAALLSRKEYNWENWQESILPIIATLAPAGLLILLQPDLGTATIIGAIFFVMLFVAGVPGRYLSMLALAGLTGLCILIIVAPYRTGRLSTFLHPELDPQGKGYQINQAFLAVGSGGLFGEGYGQSRQKYQYLPEVNADSIFAVVAEELGFFVSSAVILLIIFIGWRILRIARRSKDPGALLIGAGVATWFLTQSFLNIGAMVGALPLTGVPLPLVSHGGTAMLANLAALGVVAGISKHS